MENNGGVGSGQEEMAIQQEEAHKNMKNLQTLRAIPGPLAALVLLFACELLLLDAAANYVIIYGIGKGAFFAVASLFVALFSAGVMFWAALKVLPAGGGLADGMRAGAVAGAYASLAACLLVAAFALAGAGVAKYLPESGLAEAAWTYLLVFLLIMLAYPLAGAICGALAALYSERRMKKK